MKCNVGKVDRFVRLVLTLVLAAVAYTYNIVWLYVVAAILLLTALFGLCPVYALLGKSTCKEHSMTPKPSRPAPGPMMKSVEKKPAAKKKRRRKRRK